MQCVCQNEVEKNEACLLPKPQKFRVNDSHSASSRKPRRRRGLGIEAEILFCLKKDWSGKPAPSGKPPNNEKPLIPNSSEIRQHFFGLPYSLSIGGEWTGKCRLAEGNVSAKMRVKKMRRAYCLNPKSFGLIRKPFQKIFPGFKIPFGSKTFLMPRIKFKFASLMAKGIYGRLVMPMPCSPESVPPSFTVNSKISPIPFGISFSQRRSSMFSFKILTCRFPSPKCPKQTVLKP